jgi:hypothetical protein
VTERRLKLRDAADELGITPDALRQRVRRGQYRGEKVEGRWYVYLNTDPIPHRWRRSLAKASKQLLGERGITIVSALATVVGSLLVLAYPIGFVSFWWQLRRYYSYDDVTALYAASTVPSTISIGGALGTVQWAHLGALSTLFVFGVRMATRGEWLRGLWRRGPVALWLAVGAGAVYLAVVSLWPYCLFYLRPLDQEYFDYFWYFGAWIGTVLGGYYGAELAFAGFRAQRGTTWGGISRRWLFFLGAAFWVLVVAITTTTIFAALRYPMLPVVEVKSERPEYDGKFALVSHSDGYWYVFDKHPTFDQDPQSAELSAITDKEVEEVQFLRMEPYSGCPGDAWTLQDFRRTDVGRSVVGKKVVALWERVIG